MVNTASFIGEPGLLQRINTSGVEPITFLKRIILFSEGPPQLGTLTREECVINFSRGKVLLFCVKIMLPVSGRKERACREAGDKSC